MKKAGIVLFVAVVAALAFAVLQPTAVYLMRQRLYGRGVAWSSNKCVKDADCVAVGCWVTAKKNQGMSQLLRAANELHETCSLTVRCTNSTCVQGP